MNNPFNMTNDLNGFRSSIGNSIATYDHNIDVLNTGVIRRKAEAAKKAAETLSKGAELLRTGLETEGAIVGGKAIGAAGKAIYGAVSKRLGGAASKATEALGENVQSTTSTIGDTATQAVEAPSSSIEMTGRSVAQTSGDTELSDMVSVRGRPGARTGVESAEADNYEAEGLRGTRGTVNTQQVEDRARMVGEDRDAPARPGQVQEQGETKEREPYEEGENADIPDDQLRPQGNMGDAADLGEDLAQDAGDAVNSGVSAAEGAGNALAGAGDAVGSAVSGAGDALGSALAGGGAAGETALLEAASATSWIPFVGEVMGGIAAVGGLVAAGVGIYDDVVGGAQQAKADLMPDKLKSSQLPTANLAGSYVAPIASSVNV